jgi:Uma2 family endonuclease
MALRAYEEHYTVDDYNRWEGDWELIWGRPYAMSPFALPAYQKISLKIARQLDEALDECPKCHALMKTEVAFSEDTVVRPDAMVVCYPLKERLTRRPELVFEVVSKQSARRDEHLKFELYESEGIPYYILVYPDLRKAKVYKLTEGRYQKVGDFTEGHYRFELPCPIEFDFGFVFR